MKLHGPINAQGNKITNLSLDKGTGFPSEPTDGFVFIKNNVLYWYDTATSKWYSTPGAGEFQGDIYPEIQVELPQSTSKGDWWFFNGGGDMGGILGEDVKPGDMIIAKENDAADIDGFTVIRIDRTHATFTEEQKTKILAVIALFTGEPLKISHASIDGLGDLALLDTIPIEKVDGLQAALDALENSQWLQDLETNFEALVTALIIALRPDEHYKNPNFNILLSEMTGRIESLEALVDELNTANTLLEARVETLENE